ncbi:hypothetical protein [Actinoallomurus vinaceus]
MSAAADTPSVWEEADRFVVIAVCPSFNAMLVGSGDVLYRLTGRRADSFS